MVRIASAVLGVALFFGILFFVPPLGFVILIATGTTAGLAEFFALARKGGVNCYRVVGLAFGLLVFFAVALRPAAAGLAAVLCVLAVSLFALGKRAPPQAAVGEMALTCFGVFFVAFPLGFLAQIRTAFQGEFLVLYILGIAWMGDTGAFYVGRSLGRHKLAPRVSPKKTVEGAIGGIIFSLVGAGILGLFPVRLFSLPEALLLGLLLNVAGQAGDLVESVVKRWAGAKDASGLIPGHGGFLDRFDSLLMAAPVYYLYLNVTGGVHF
jgi:phosphatidate cytidylyltransferase